MTYLMPQPFAWITIPVGEVTLEADGYLDAPTTFTVPSFEIAKYPVTTLQFRRFIEAGGYAESRWWTEAGWQNKLNGWTVNPRIGDWEKTNIPTTKPASLSDSKTNGETQPIVDIPWYVAVAFCNWLSEATGEKITLPTEQQWQRAAQGDDGRLYPWGNEWDKTRCNNKELTRDLQLRRTTCRVTEFEGLGDSPYGVVDMSGNVWEWCLTAYKTGSIDVEGTDARVARGGAYWYDEKYFRTSFRQNMNPEGLGSTCGFRLVRSIK